MRRAKTYTHMVETREMCIDTHTGKKELFCFQYRFDNKEEAMRRAERFNRDTALPEQAFVRIWKHGLWLRIA